ncbi:MAG: OmpH family outer membrane protein [Prevotella sp.]|nr:OmpH family outer membrane protein [Candidatus Equicola faecalis]
MKRILFIFTILAVGCMLPLTASAQQAFAHFSYKAVIAQLPDVAQISDSLAHLQAGLDREVRRVEQDFNEKYEEFLEGQKEFPAIIRQKRQTELQEMMQRNVALKQEVSSIYMQTKEALDTALREKVNVAVRKIGQEYRYAFIFNSDDDRCPWIDATQCADVTQQIIAELCRQ